MTDNVRAAVYLRISLDATGERLAVTRQREDCLKLARDRGWTVTEEYVDNSVSASDARKLRPAYERMVGDYAAGRFDALVCYDLDRLTRQPRQLEDWIDAAEGRGLRLVTANGEADLTTDGGRMYARIKAAVARAEVERKGARQARALRQRAERGLPGAGVRLTGYTEAGDVIPDEAAMVRSMFDRFAAGESILSVTRWASDNGYRTRTGRPWNPSTVRQMLTNPRYAGRATFKGEDINLPGQWEAIVPSEKFSAVQSILNDPRRATNRRGSHRTHLGSGLYRCADCGDTVLAWSRTRYRCRAGCLSRVAEPIDELVLAITSQALADPRLGQRLADHSDDEQLARLTERVETGRARLATIEADYDAGLIDGRRYATATDKVNAQIKAAERQQASILAAGAPGSVLDADKPGEAFLMAPLGIQQSVISALMTVTLRRARRGPQAFDPQSVEIEWRQQL